MVEQLSVFLQNEAGRLAQMCRVLADTGHNMRVLMVADTAEYGVVRVLCDRPHAARRSLEQEGFAVSVTPVLAVRVPDSPGGLATVLETLGEAGINVEYLYCYVRPDAAEAVDIFRVEDTAAATSVLEAVGIGMVRAAEIYELDAA